MHVLIILLFFSKFYGNFGLIPWFLFNFEFLDIVPHWSISNLQRVVSQRKLIYKTPYLFPDLVLFSVKIYDYKCKNGQNQNAWMINWMATTMKTALPNVLGPKSINWFICNTILLSFEPGDPCHDTEWKSKIVTQSL